MIGLVDYDLQTATGSHPHYPNLEIMKLATFYRIEQQQFCRLVPLDDKELTAYEKIYFFSEADVLPTIPEAFLRARNVVFGGTAFTNGIYRPFENEIIDYILAKPAIYKDYLKQCLIDGMKPRAIEHILDDSYFRQYAGTNKLPLPAISPRKRLWVYDMDFFQEGWNDWVTEATKRNCSSIVSIHPIVCHKFSEYLALREQIKIARSNQVVLDINIPLDETKYLFKEYKSYLLGDIMQSTSVYLKIGGSYPSNAQYEKDLIYKLNLLYCFWSNSIPIKLLYFPPRIGARCHLTNLLPAIELWANSNNRDWTINDKITRKKMKKPTPEYAEELIILKFHPGAADLFKQSYNDLAARRLWRI
jgi:hypothetical protein